MLLTRSDEKHVYSVSERFFYSIDGQMAGYQGSLTWCRIMYFLRAMTSLFAQELSIIYSAVHVSCMTCMSQSSVALSLYNPPNMFLKE